MHRDTTGRALAIVAGTALATSLALPSHAIFGFGKKDQKEAEGDRQSAGKLPGMPDTGEEGAPSDKPRMADEVRTEGQGERRASGSEEPRSGPPPASLSAGSGLPTEVVIKGDSSSKMSSQKPPLKIEGDPFESIRPSLKPDEFLLLAESPLTIAWRRTHPEFLANARVLEPWRTTFSERPGIAFSPREQLFEVVGRKLEPKEAKGYQWQLTIADEEGRVFQHYEGSSNPPEELVWSGQNDQGEWIKAGRSYSPIFMFTDPGGSPHTKVGKTLQFTGVIHQEPDGLHVSLDSAVLFGSGKGARAIEKAGNGLLRAAADLIKRRYTGIPVRVEAFASTKDLGDAQAKIVQESLVGELMILSQHLNNEGASAPFSEQRVEIVLLNR